MRFSIAGLAFSYHEYEVCDRESLSSSVRQEQQYRLEIFNASIFQSPPRSRPASHPRKKNSHKKAPRSDGRPSENQNTQRSARYEASHRLLHQNFASIIHITLNIHTTNQPTQKNITSPQETGRIDQASFRHHQHLLLLQLLLVPTDRDIYHRLSNPPTKFNF